MILSCFFMISIKLRNSNNTLTSKHASIRFTSEIEINNLLAFLGIKIVTENRFTTSVPHKSTFCGLFISFESFTLNWYKYALIFTLLQRAFKLFSNFELFH